MQSIASKIHKMSVAMNDSDTPADKKKSRGGKSRAKVKAAT